MGLSPGSSRGGTGTVTSVTAGNGSIVVAGTATDPTLTTGTLDAIATAEPPAAAVAMNAKKITGLAVATAATDAASLANTLDQFGAPAANVAMNAKKLTGLGPGSGAGDSIRWEQIFAAGALPIADIADPGAGFVIGSSSGAAAVRPPGFVWSYTQITSTANVTDTSESTATALISPGAFTPDGAALWAEFFCSELIPPSTVGGFVIVTLFEGVTEITRLCFATNNVAGTQIENSAVGRYKFTPSNASHTYKLCAFCSATTGTPGIVAANGGANNPPAYVRFVKD